MLPGSALSSTVLSGDFLPPRHLTKVALEDYELGGVAIGDPSAGLMAKTWHAFVEEDGVYLEADGVAPSLIYPGEGITEVQVTFDQAMRVFIAFVQDDTAKYYWYDSVAEEFTTSELPAGSYNPRCSLDDKRSLQLGASDIILAYLRAGTLYFRAQRDRYLTEYELTTGLGSGARLLNVGMNDVNRFQFMLRGVE